MSFLFPDKPKELPPPPSSPTKADASVITAGVRTPSLNLNSLISSASSLGKKSAATGKKSLIGGSGPVST